jgi:glutamate 5-kinase
MIDCCVVKIGSALLTGNGQGLDRSLIARLVAEIVALQKTGTRCVLVSSGAVAQGMAQLGLSRRPTSLPELQALAALGQMGLVQAYSDAFLQHDVHAAQVLLTHDELVHRQRYLNARATLRSLQERNIVPIVNENDAVATEEMCFGDNDTLAAVVAQLVEASLLIILTDQAGLYESDPRQHPGAKLVRVANVSDERLKAYVGGSVTGLGRGGMITKLLAAEQAARVGAATLIMGVRECGIDLQGICQDPVVVPGPDGVMSASPRVFSAGSPLGTLLLPTLNVLKARKRWLAAHRQVAGSLVVDAGAERALVSQGKSLLPVGVLRVDGEFQRGALVAIQSESGRVIAHGLVNYSSGEAASVCGLPSGDLLEVLGYAGDVELVHRDNLVLASGIVTPG